MLQAFVCYLTFISIQNKADQLLNILLWNVFKNTSEVSICRGVDSIHWSLSIAKTKMYSLFLIPVSLFLYTHVLRSCCASKPGLIYSLRVSSREVGERTYHGLSGCRRPEVISPAFPAHLACFSLTSTHSPSLFTGHLSHLRAATL